MYLKSRIIYLYLETYLHVGAGAGLGAIDLPIQRERYSGFPIIQASGFKGALRSICPDEGENALKHKVIFGAEDASVAAAFGVGDARLLLFPVRSVKGVYAWATCLEILHRWQRELMMVSENELWELPAPLGANQCYAGSGIQSNGYVVLEEFAFRVGDTKKLSPLAEQLTKTFPTVPIKRNNVDVDAYQYWKDRLKTHLVILPDDDFSYLVEQTTEKLSRNRLDRDTKTGVEGALWTEEHLPDNSVMYAPARASRLRVEENGGLDELLKINHNGSSRERTPEEQAQAVLDWVYQKTPSILQIGGHETVGRGLVRLTWTG